MTILSNPFKESSGESDNDAYYVKRALEGDNESLEYLILRHQSWIFNISLRFVGDALDAEDITQEILIKIITRLSTYDSDKSAFRTWLYRITINHILNIKQSKKEAVFGFFSSRSDLNDLIEFQPDTRKIKAAGDELMDRETKINCSLCILLCLSRMERLIFMLGVIFDIPDRLGAEICEVTYSNYRKILSRSRNKVFEFFNKNCSFIKQSNPCSCNQQTDKMIAAGIINAGDLLENRESYGRIRDVVGNAISDIEDTYYEFTMLIKDRPFFKGPDMVAWISDLLHRKIIRVG